MKLAMALFCAACAFCQDAGVSGKWSGIFSQGPIFVVLTQDGNKLSGTGGPTEKQQMLEFKNGSVEGDHVVFAGGAFHFDLRLTGGELRGEFTNGGEVSKIYLKRVVSTPGGAPPSFEVASVKRAPTPVGGYNSSMKLDPGRITCTNVSLKKLIMNSYDLKDYQISGPDWLESELYNIVATMPRETTGDDAIRMVQSLLTERFKLTMHHETRELPVYALVVGKTGPKLKEVEFGPGNTSARPGKLSARKTALVNLANFLSRQMERPVLDMTGLKGFYDFELEWTPDEGAKPPEVGAPADSAIGPSLAMALQQQLGLRLETRKAPVDVVIVDRAERVPTEN